MQFVIRQLFICTGAILFGIVLYFGVKTILIIFSIPVTDDNLTYGVSFVVLTIGLYLAFKK